MARTFLRIGSICLSLGLFACAASPPQKSTAAPAPTIDGNAVLGHVKVMASDEYEGRAPGTKGEDLSVAYVTE
jgi:hypothetical protein